MFYIRVLIIMITLIEVRAYAQGSIRDVRERSGSRHWLGKARWSLSGLESSEERMVSESARVEFAGGLTFEKSFDDELNIQFAPAFRFVSGREQDVFADRLPKDKIYVDEARIRWSPGNTANFEAGAINQIRLSNPLIVSARPFPAAAAGFNLSENFSISGEYAIPTSYTLETNVTDNERLPNFAAGSLGYSFRPSRDFSIQLAGSYFKYDRLPQVVAVSSSALGNSVDISSSATGRFHYEFEGMGVGGIVAKRLGGLDLEWSGNAIQNFKAPSRLNRGFVSSVSASKPIATNQEAGLGLSYYRVEPDTGSLHRPGFRKQPDRRGRTGFYKSPTVGLEVFGELLS